jgi:hypothetical protein
MRLWGRPGVTRPHELVLGHRNAAPDATGEVDQRVDQRVDQLVANLGHATPREQAPAATDSRGGGCRTSTARPLPTILP